MRTVMHNLGRKWLFPAAMALALLPVTMLCCQGPVDGGGCIPQGIAVLGVYLALALVCLATPGRFRLAVGLSCALLLGAAVWWIMPHGEPVVMIPAVLAIGLLLWGVPMGGWKDGEEPTFGLYMLGNILYLLYYALLSLSDRTDKEMLHPILLAGFLPMMLLTLLAMNRASLASAARRGKAPRIMRRMNALLTGALMLGVTLIAALPALTRWARAAWDLTLKGIMRFALWLMSLMPDTTGSGESAAAGGSLDLSGLAGAEPSPFLEWTERVLYVVGVVLMVLLLALVVWGLYLLGRQLLRRMMTAMKRYAEAAGGDYEDEIESTRDEGEREQIRRRAARRSRRVNEARLSPRERVRYRYQRAAALNGWSDASTAREQLSAPSAEVYERARYSEHEVTGAEADAFAAGLTKRSPHR